MAAGFRACKRCAPDDAGGDPVAARLIERAATLLAVAIPCHRAVRENGELAGYRWGLARKRALLEREAAALTR